MTIQIECEGALHHVEAESPLSAGYILACRLLSPDAYLQCMRIYPDHLILTYTT